MGWWFDSWGGGLILGYKVPARFYVLSFPGWWDYKT